MAKWVRPFPHLMGIERNARKKRIILSLPVHVTTSYAQFTILPQFFQSEFHLTFQPHYLCLRSQHRASNSFLLLARSDKAMARFLMLVALCVLPAIVSAGHPFWLDGRVYCDTCRFGFETPLSTYIEGMFVLFSPHCVVRMI